MGRALIFLIRLYQKHISPLLGRNCRFEPTCSQYAIEAITVHGPIKGLGLAIWRILRCNPWGKWGYDPVPEPKHKCARHPGQDRPQPTDHEPEKG